MNWTFGQTEYTVEEQLEEQLEDQLQEQLQEHLAVHKLLLSSGLPECAPRDLFIDLVPSPVQPDDLSEPLELGEWPGQALHGMPLELGLDLDDDAMWTEDEKQLLRRHA